MIGASPNPERYAWLAVQRLTEAGEPVTAVGLRGGHIGSVEIRTDRPVPEDVRTVSLYVGPANQGVWTDYIFSLQPERIILNPGTEGGPVEAIAKAQGVEVLRACTLVMLSSRTY